MRLKKLSHASLAFALALVAGCRKATDDAPPSNRDTAAPPHAAAAASPEARATGAAANTPPATEAAGVAEPGREPGGVAAGTGAAPAATNAAAAPRPASRSWRILSVSGAWFAEGEDSRTLARGDALRPGGVVRLRPEQGRPQYLVLVDRSSRTRRVECEPVERCARGWTVPDVPVSKSTFAHVIDTALDLLSRNPRVYINPISRGGGVREAVLLFAEEGTDLSPALGRLTPGRHTIEIAPAGRGARADAKTLTVEFRRDARNPEPVRAAGLRPGLYRLTLDRTAGGATADADAWVVVSAPASYGKTSARFREASAVTEAWGDAVEADVARGFLRAYLEHLAARGARD